MERIVDLAFVHGLCFVTGLPVCEQSLKDTVKYIGTPVADFWDRLKSEHPEHYHAGRLARRHAGYSMDVSRNYQDQYRYE